MVRDPHLDLANQLGIDKWELVHALIESETMVSAAPVPSDLEPTKNPEEASDDLRTYFGNL